MNETEAFILWHYIIGIVPQILFKWGQLCFCQHNGTPSDEKIIAASSLLAGGGGGEVAHFENDTASEK